MKCNNYYVTKSISIWQYNLTVVSHSIYIACVLAIWTNFYNFSLRFYHQTMLAICTEVVSPSAVCPPTTISSLWGRTASKHWDREVAMWLMTFQELVVVLYMWIAVVFLSSELFPPTASSCSCSEVHVDSVTGESASWCHTLGLLANDKVFSCAPRDCGWQDWMRAASEQVNTDLEYSSLWSKPPSM